jgi:hypothetical protein
MKRSQVCIFSIIVGVLSVSLVLTAAHAGGFLSDLGDKLKAADQELADVEMVLEQKGQEFEKLINKEVEEGMVKIDAFNQELNQEIEGLRSELKTKLSEENLQELKNYLDGLDDKVIDRIRQEIIAKLSERLKLSPEQVEQLTPILREEFQKRSALLEKYLGQGPGQFEAYQAENDALWQETLSRLQKVLTPEQVQELEAWRSELREKVRQAFAEKK